VNGGVGGAVVIIENLRGDSVELAFGVGFPPSHRKGPPMPSEHQSHTISDYFWWHSIELVDGVITPGRKSLELMAREAGLFFDPVALSGRTVLDVGAWNGGFSVVAKRRGAARVLATDSLCWGPSWVHPHFRGREAFDLVLASTGLDIEAREIDATEISVGTVGQFDVVLFLGVFYHLFDPISTLKRLVDVTREVLIVETHLGCTG
jgi:tRNA (mo5U34)-methyltransferase